VHTGFLRGNVREDLDVDKMIILKWIIKKLDVRAYIGWIWLRAETGLF
jgi:hypothetical protein